MKKDGIQTRNRKISSKLKKSVRDHRLDAHFGFFPRQPYPPFNASLPMQGLGLPMPGVPFNGLSYGAGIPPNLPSFNTQSFPGGFPNPTSNFSNIGTQNFQNYGLPSLPGPNAQTTNTETSQPTESQQSANPATGGEFQNDSSLQTFQ